MGWAAGRCGVSLLLLSTFATPAGAQTIGQALTFLLTNRSVQTGDFSGDQQAAAATRDAMGTLLQEELATVPTASPAGGFTYRLDRTLGVNVRSSDSFGPFFNERSLTVGARRASMSIGYGQATYDNISGLALKNGTLVATASQLQGQSQPFDVETLTLHIQTRTTTVSGEVGVTDRMDVGVVVPFETVDLNGTRVDNFRGTSVTQATAVATATGIGDVIVRAKYNVWRSGGSGLTIGTDVRAPTGNADNFLGTGHGAVIPRVIGSFDRGAIAAHGDFGYAWSWGNGTDQIEYGGAVTWAASHRLTIVGEAVGRWLSSGGDLTYVTAPHPGLVGVDTIRLTGADTSTTRAWVVAGVRWNVSGRWVLSANVLRPITKTGLNASWVPAMILDYSFGK
jgi:hypothetical protein